MPRVIVRLGKKDGTIRARAEGFKGEACDDAMSFLDELFGAPVEKERTPEYYEKAQSDELLPNGFCG